MDRHDVPGSTAEETARNHAADLEVAGEFGVEFLSYWHDSERGLVFCLARAPEQEAVSEAHAAAHGLVPAEIMEVSESDVVRFLGKVHDPVDAGDATSAFRIVGFTDLVRSTELLDRLGQNLYVGLLKEHDIIIREALIRWKGREVKHTGDGFMVAFEDVSQALGWALDVRGSFEERSDMDVRIGLAAGEPVDHQDDFFGASVTMAARICSVAGAGVINVSDLVRDLGADAGYRFNEGRSTELKGFAEPAAIYELLGEA